jgi:hypothetical protein
MRYTDRRAKISASNGFIFFQEHTMNIRMIRNAVIALALGSMASFAMAQADAAKTIAGIVGSVNHFPSAEQKATLAAIQENTANSEAIKKIAKAVHDMQHSATAEDKAALQAIAADESANKAERELAEIVAGLNHMANDDAKARLASIQ